MAEVGKKVGLKCSTSDMLGDGLEACNVHDLILNNRGPPRRSDLRQGSEHENARRFQIWTPPYQDEDRITVR